MKYGTQGVWQMAGIMQKMRRNVPVGYMCHLEEECKECKGIRHMLNQTDGCM